MSSRFDRKSIVDSEEEAVAPVTPKTHQDVRLSPLLITVSMSFLLSEGRADLISLKQKPSTSARPAATDEDGDSSSDGDEEDDELMADAPRHESNSSTAARDEDGDGDFRPTTSDENSNSDDGDDSDDSDDDDDDDDDDDEDEDDELVAQTPAVRRQATGLIHTPTRVLGLHTRPSSGARSSPAVQSPPAVPSPVQLPAGPPAPAGGDPLGLERLWCKSCFKEGIYFTDIGPMPRCEMPSGSDVCTHCQDRGLKCEPIEYKWKDNADQLMLEDWVLREQEDNPDERIFTVETLTQIYSKLIQLKQEACLLVEGRDMPAGEPLASSSGSREAPEPKHDGKGRDTAILLSSDEDDM
ncbi:hypothetical protein FPRO04_13267 [Fusarium proliferatum]|nr:hypothetical protein FPRO04_13267 [Fusarium proliferatum]